MYWVKHRSWTPAYYPKISSKRRADSASRPNRSARDGHPNSFPSKAKHDSPNIFFLFFGFSFSMRFFYTWKKSELKIKTPKNKKKHADRVASRSDLATRAAEPTWSVVGRIEHGATKISSQRERQLRSITPSRYISSLRSSSGRPEARCMNINYSTESLSLFKIL